MNAPRDPFRYFRVEARDIHEELGRGMLQLEKGAAPDLVPRLLRLAHTLKGAARVVKHQGIAEQAHAIEEVLAPLRDTEVPVSRDHIQQVFGRVDRIAAHIAELEPQAPKESDPSAPAQATESLRAVRTDVTEMDTLLDGVYEASVQVRTVKRAIGDVGRALRLAETLIERTAARSTGSPRSNDGAVSPEARPLAEELRTLIAGLHQNLTGGIDQAEREMLQVRDAAEQLRLLPASVVFPPLERTVRDVAQSLGKQASFDAKGGDIRLDAHVLNAMQPALVQAVRNAVAHGIESDAERAQAGKPAVGRVAIEVIRRGNRVAFICQDDGRGIDLEAVRRVAQKRGVLSSDGQNLTVDDLLRLLFRGGLTTSGAVTELSGRGIGLDVVREVAARLGGEVTARTEAGRGTSLDLVVPVSLSSLGALLVDAGGTVAAVPLDAVRQTLRVMPGDVARTAEGDSVMLDGKAIPFVPLARLLRAEDRRRKPQSAWSAVVIGGATSLTAVGVDRLLGTANVVMRPLPPLAPADPFVAGVALDAEGIPQLVLDPEGLVKAAHYADLPPGIPAAEPPAPILVIDDSLTTRMLEKSILESAGYEVDLAISAEEALAKAAGRRYGLFLVDVEMPGMDGFAFIAKTRADPELREVPAILVTSRNAPEDRRRGIEAGAQAYIVKGEFDQGQVLETIRKLVR